MELDSLYLAVALVTLAAPVFRAPWRIALGTGGLIGVTLIVAGLPDWYNPDAAMSSFSLISKSFPPKMTIPHVGYPGVKNYPCQVSGLHANNMAPTTPNDLNSETANLIGYKAVPSAGWLPRIADTSVGVYDWADWVVFSHKTTLWPFYYSSFYETAKCGLGPGAALWDGHPDGGTYCKASEDFYLLPSKKEACLGDFIGTLACNATSGWCSLQGQTVKINGAEVVGAFYLAPFDSEVRAGTETDSCEDLFSQFYYDTSSVSISFPGTGKTIKRAGKSLVPETLLGSSHLDSVILCNLSAADVPPGALVIGLLPMDVSFVYRPGENSVHLYTSQKVTISNDWRSVLVINLCLFCLAHWLADTDKYAESLYTIVPEIVGLFAAAAGIYLQKITNSVFRRCADLEHGSLAAELVTWVVLLDISANVACLILLRSQEEPLANPLKAKVNTVRKLSYECALLGSVYLQVVSSTDNMVCMPRIQTSFCNLFTFH